MRSGSPALDPANQGMTVQLYISTFLKGSVSRRIPGEFLTMTVRDALESVNATVRELLTSKGYLKGGG